MTNQKKRSLEDRLRGTATTEGAESAFRIRFDGTGWMAWLEGHSSYGAGTTIHEALDNLDRLYREHIV